MQASKDQIHLTEIRHFNLYFEIRAVLPICEYKKALWGFQNQYNTFLQTKINTAIKTLLIVQKGISTPK